jgi:hypothetical protein
VPGPLLETTRQTELQPFKVGGVPVFQTLGQIRAELGRALSDEHALLFAEPNVDSETGDIQWYAPFNGTAIRLDQLRGAELSKAWEKIAHLVDGISKHAETLEGSSSAASRLMQNNLRLALEIPHESHIFVVDDRPVIAGWGHVPNGPAVERRALQRKAAEVLSAPSTDAKLEGGAPFRAATGADDKPQSGIAEPAAEVLETPARSSRFRLGIARNTLASVPVVAERISWLSSLLWLLFSLLLLVIGYLLLKYCAIGLPGAVNDVRRAFINFCDGPGVVATLPTDRDPRQRNLLNRLAELDSRLREKRNACTAQNVPRPVGPRSVSPVVPGQPGHLTQEGPPSAGSKEIITGRGGQIGAVNVILRWETTDDLDLYVRCPDQNEINFSQPRACGGALDVDANVNAPIATPAENITWPENAAQPGEYLVQVNRYANRAGSPTTSFTVELLIEGKRVEIHPDSVGDEKKEVFRFTLPYVPH